MDWVYERMRDDGTVEVINEFTNDLDGSFTGRIVINAKAYFDENPEERIRLGWTKHIIYSKKEASAKWPHSSQTQYLARSMVQVDEYTVEDVYHVMDKSEEQLLQEEIMEACGVSIISF